MSHKKLFSGPGEPSIPGSLNKKGEHRMNRKLTSVLLAIVMLLSIVVPAFAQQENVDVYENQTLIKSVAFIIGLNEYFVDDQVPGVKMDTAPFIQDGRTFVPVRFLGNALGVPDEDIRWNQAERRVDMKRQSNTLSMVIGKPEITVNGQAKLIDVLPAIRDSRTFLPARYVAEGLGFEVDWDPVNHIVICWPKGEPKPELSNVKKYVSELKTQEDAYYYVSGYRIPKETDIRVEGRPDFTGIKLPPGISPNDYAELTLYLKTNHPFQKQIDQLRDILEPKLGKQVTQEIIDYISLKGDNQYCELKTRWWKTEDKEIEVGSDWGMTSIEVQIFPKS